MGKSHKWIPQMSGNAQKFFDSLCPESRAKVFSELQELCEAENPLAVRGVCPIEGEKNVWRIHADTHNLRLRVFFVLVPIKVIRDGYEYKGYIQVPRIRKKDENTYSK